LVLVLLLAIDAGKEQKAEAVPVHVATGLAGNVRVADLTAGLRAGNQPVARQADVLGILAGADGAALTEQGHTAQGGHGNGILASLRLPVTVAFVLLADEPLQRLLDGGAILHRHSAVGPGRRSAQQKEPTRQGAENVSGSHRHSLLGHGMSTGGQEKTSPLIS